MPNPICPACGDEMEYTDHDGLASYWSCEKEDHSIIGPLYDDEYGEKTKKMISFIRQEKRIEDIENDAHFQYGQLIEARNRAKRAENRVSELELQLKETGDEV